MSGRRPPAAGVIGWPVAHSKSPAIHRFWLGKLGLDGDYGRFPVAPEHLEAALRALPALGLRGVNVTVPHKQAVIPFLDAVEPDALEAGAVNTVVVGPKGELVGVNTDDVGFIDPLRTLPRTIRTATVIGAGGAARAILLALRAMGVTGITVINRSEARAFELVATFPAIRTVEPLTDGHEIGPTDLLVNATSLGMVGQPALGVSLDRLADHAIVYDIVYAPLETGLLADARARGLRTVDGLQMLVGQAAAAFKLLFGHDAPREHDDELRALLTR